MARIHVLISRGLVPRHRSHPARSLTAHALEFARRASAQELGWDFDGAARTLRGALAAAESAGAPEDLAPLHNQQSFLDGERFRDEERFLEGERLEAWVFGLDLERDVPRFLDWLLVEWQIHT